MSFAIILSTLLLTSPAAIPEAGSVSSSNASYDGNALILKGQVLLDHGLGKMQAEEAMLQKQEVGKDFPFSLIHLQKDVLLSLKNHATIKCGTADLDFNALKGTLLSEEQIIYTDQVKKKKGVTIPLQLLSKEADLQFSKKEGSTPEHKASFDVDTVLAKENVRIDYGVFFSLFADQAIYRKGEMNPASGTFQKNISAFPTSDQGVCRLVHEQDEVIASAVDVDLVHSRVVLAHPRGHLHAFLIPEKANQDVHFQADTLVWDHQKNLLSLKGNVSLNEPSLGTIQTEEELSLLQHGNKLASIQTKGKTTVQYANSHKLLCFGSLHIDQEKLHAFGESPQIQGVVPEGKQIYYEEGEVGIFADHAQVEYTTQEQSFDPVSISLKGHIRVFSHDPQKPARRGVADRITYLPTTRTFILGADPGKKVLFFNEAENLRISAQEVHMTEDPSTKKQTVKGIGNVQLAFTAEEQELMQKLFHTH